MSRSVMGHLLHEAAVREGGVDVQHVVETFGIGGGELVEVQADPLRGCPIAAPFLALLATSIVDEDAAHGLRRGGEEVAATVPVLRSLDIHQSEVGFVN